MSLKKECTPQADKGLLFTSFKECSSLPNSCWMPADNLWFSHLQLLIITMFRLTMWKNRPILLRQFHPILMFTTFVASLAHFRGALEHTQHFVPALMLQTLHTLLPVVLQMENTTLGWIGFIQWSRTCIHANMGHLTMNLARNCVIVSRL